MHRQNFNDVTIVKKFEEERRFKMLILANNFLAEVEEVKFICDANLFTI